MIENLTFHRFKQFTDHHFDLHPNGVTLIGGGNNSGKTTLLHGLAVWEFCRTAISEERGSDAFLADWSGLGLGLGDDEFSPINVPSLKHLWSNLKTQKDGEPDGYTLKIRAEWTESGEPRYLEFSLSLANDRLFLKATASNLHHGDRIPRVAYLPPFAGITDREMRITGAIRRRRMGEGLAGAVLRNLLLEMWEENENKRRRLREGKAKISDADLRSLRSTDPWELLQQTLRQTFSAHLDIAPFREEYHSYIQVVVDKGTVSGFKLKRHPGYNPRDLMVEGSGFLQWLSVYTLALDPAVDVLLLDEPDAHLHSSLQDQLISNLRDLAGALGKQVLVATHSSEILRNSEPSKIFHIRGSAGGRYLTKDMQKVALLAGLGSDYAPRIDGLKKTRRLLFVEGVSDLAVLHIFAETLRMEWPSHWVDWTTSRPQKERKQLHLAFREEISGLVTLSLRDRDDEPANVGPDLLDSATTESDDFAPRRWRRRYIESYLLWPAAIASATGMAVSAVETQLAEQHGIAIPRSFPESDAPAAIMDVRAKAMFRSGSVAMFGQFDATPLDVAAAMEPDAIPDDIKTFLAEIAA